MLYLIISFFILICILKYDLYGNTKNKGICIGLITIILVLVSGFSYRIGGDGINYLNEYKDYGTISDLSIDYFGRYSLRYMPGWIVLCTVCKSITSSYWFFKLVHALIVNIAFVRTIKTNAQYVFTGIFLYFVLIYFNMNFQALREALAVSMFFFAIPSFYKKNWIRYYLLALLAVLFHDGAIVVFILPLIRIMGINKYSIGLFFIAAFFLFYYASDFLNLLFSADFGSYQYRIDYYMEQVDNDYSFSAWANSLLNIVFPIIILFVYIKKKIPIKYLYLALFSILLYTMSLIVPIVYRFTNYVLIFHYILLMDFLLKVVTHRTMKKYGNKSLAIIVSFLLILSFTLFKGRFYFNSYGSTGIPQYVQYYPYSSVFDKTTTEERERLYRVMD